MKKKNLLVILCFFNICNCDFLSIINPSLIVSQWLKHISDSQDRYYINKIAANDKIILSNFSILDYANNYGSIAGIFVNFFNVFINTSLNKETKKYFTEEPSYDEYFFEYSEINNNISVDSIREKKILEGFINKKNEEKMLVCLSAIANNLKLPTPKLRSVLLSGPPGTGKTKFAMKIASYLGSVIPGGITLRTTSIGRLLRYPSIQALEEIRNLLEFSSKKNNFLFIDEVDLLLQDRDTYISKNKLDLEISERMKNLLIYFFSRSGSHNLNIIFATNTNENIDPSFQRRIQFKIEFQLPNKSERKEIFNYYMKKMRIKISGINNEAICNLGAKNTENFSGSDIEKICYNLKKYQIIQKNSRIFFSDFKFVLDRALEMKKILSGDSVKKDVKEPKENILDRIDTNYHFNSNMEEIISVKYNLTVPIVSLNRTSIVEPYYEKYKVNHLSSFHFIFNTRSYEDHKKPNNVLLFPAPKIMFLKRKNNNNVFFITKRNYLYNKTIFFRKLK